MKHAVKIIILLLSMFFVTQLIGLAVIHQYTSQVQERVDDQGVVTNQTIYNLPYGMEPPQDITPASTLISIVIAIIIAVVLMLILMKYKAAFLLKFWFFIVVTLALGITINAAISPIPYSSLIALAIALPFSFLKLIKRNIWVHNFTELLIYPGIAIIFVPLLSIWTTVLLLILISFYDMYAVWRSGFMQKMAEYQIKKLKVFTGFFVPYLGEKERVQLKKAKTSNKKNKKLKVNVAILGGGDVVFPIILAGVVLKALGTLTALIISVGATLGLGFLFYISKKGKFYPAMPFITAGCLLALGITYLI
jgi:presenilin-like A22 family membrane protease